MELAIDNHASVSRINGMARFIFLLLIANVQFQVNYDWFLIFVFKNIDVNDQVSREICTLC